MEPNWNEATTEQIIARAIRYKSHDALPKSQRFVNVYRLLLVDKSNKPMIDKLFHPDFSDWDIVCKAFKDDRVEVNKLKAEKEGNKKVSNKEAEAIMTKEEKEGYKKLSKEEKHKFIMNLEFSRYGAKNDRMSLINEGTPTIDLYIFVLSKSKQKIIEEMIKKFDTLHFKGLDSIQKFNFSFEDYENSLTTYLYDEIEKMYDIDENVTNEDVEEFRDIFINSQLEDLDTEFNSDRFNRLQLEHKQQKEKKDKQKKIKQLQMYFTGEEEVQKLIDLSNIADDDRELQVLEPTAGYGAIVKGIMNVVNKDNETLNVSVDMVEFDKENRVELQKLIELAPDVLSISVENNFLRYARASQYDYVFMNPPFHLRNTTNDIYTRDIYDMDFVKRAYTMLKPGGVLVAIISTRWDTIEDDITKDFKEFIDTIDGTFSSEDMTIKEWKGSKTYKDDDDVDISKISNLSISMIKIIKKSADNDFCNIILQEQLHLFNDNLIDDAISLQEATGDLNKIDDKNKEIDEDIDDEETLLNDEDVILSDIDDDDENKPRKKLTDKEQKELIQDTIETHNDIKREKKEKKKDEKKQEDVNDNNYINKNHLINKTRRGGKDTEDEINHRRELTKIDEYDKEQEKIRKTNIRRWTHDLFF